MMKAFYYKIIFSLSLLFFMPLNSFSQCAMCRAALMTGEDQSAAEGINHGITYLMVFPYILMGIMAYAVYRIIKKEMRMEQEDLTNP